MDSHSHLCRCSINISKNFLPGGEPDVTSPTCARIRALWSKCNNIHTAAPIPSAQPFPPTPPSSLPTPSLHATSNWRETLPPRRNLLKINQGEVLDAHSTPRVSLWSPVHQQKLNKRINYIPNIDRFRNYDSETTTMQKLFRPIQKLRFRNYDRPIQKLFSTDSETIFDRFRNYFPPIQKLFSTDSETIFHRFRNYFRPIQKLFSTDSATTIQKPFSTDSQNLDTRSMLRHWIWDGVGGVGWGW